MMKNINEKKFIFVCGLHRSGTSILFRSLRDHPFVSGFHNTESPEDEGMHLQSVFRPSGTYGGAGKFGFNPAAHLTENSPLVSDENRTKLFTEWGQYWDLSKPYLLEKSPPNIIRTRFLQAMFPNSYFLVLLRHPIAVSYATRAWYRKYRVYWRRFRRIFEHWIVCHEIFRQDLKYLNRVFLLRYEQFVSDPGAWVEKIYQFLNLESHSVEQKVLKGVNDKYFAMWKKDRESFFTKRSTDQIIHKFGARLAPFGYSLNDLDSINPLQFLK